MAVESKTNFSHAEAVPPPLDIDVANIERKRYFFGAQGKTLNAHIAIAGSIGFLLFGYDQGVLGVSNHLSRLSKGHAEGVFKGSQCCQRVP